MTQKINYRNDKGEFCSRREWFKNAKDIHFKTNDVNNPEVITKEKILSTLNFLELAISGSDVVKINEGYFASSDNGFSIVPFFTGSIDIYINQRFLQGAGPLDFIVDQRNPTSTLEQKKTVFRSVKKLFLGFVEQRRTFDALWDSSETDALD